MAKWTRENMGNPQNGGCGDWCSTTAVATDSPSSEEIAQMQHADIKDIAGDDQATIKVDKNYTNIVVLRNLHLREGDWCFTADGGFRRLLKQHAADIKNIAGDDQVTLTIAKPIEIYIYEIA